MSKTDPQQVVGQIRRQAFGVSFAVSLVPLLVFGGLGLYLKTTFQNNIFLIAGLLMAFIVTISSIFFCSHRVK